MKYCRNCGTQLFDEAAVCPNCGTAQEAAPAAAQDKGGFGWGLLGCCIPVVGLILFLIWKDTKPKSAKAAGIGALVSVIACVLMYILLFVIGIGASMLGYY